MSIKRFLHVCYITSRNYGQNPRTRTELSLVLRRWREMTWRSIALDQIRTTKTRYQFTQVLVIDTEPFDETFGTKSPKKGELQHWALWQWFVCLGQWQKRGLHFQECWLVKSAFEQTSLETWSCMREFFPLFRSTAPEIQLKNVWPF